VSVDLRKKIELEGIRTLTIDVSEFFEKGGGSVKCLIGDLGTP
jgi:N-dimethylarginine dimethylaminohydrolase